VINLVNGVLQYHIRCVSNMGLSFPSPAYLFAMNIQMPRGLMGVDCMS
jgi:hypothetical protein